MQDFQNSIRVLNKGGIIILDDFLWGYYKKIDENPSQTWKFQMAVKSRVFNIFSIGQKFSKINNFPYQKPAR